MKILSMFLALLCSFTGILSAQTAPLGAWKSVSGDVTSVLLVTPSWFTITDYGEKNFISSYGGTWKSASQGQVDISIQFNTENKSQVGQNATVPVGMENGRLITSSPGGGKQEWTQIDDGAGPLAGNWRITARETDGKMNPIQPGPGQTWKILTGTRFQWIAINTESGEFFGSGGGTYTFENGTYTEKIEFFSRDSSRVGAVLNFKGKVTGDDWDHSGLSSKGAPIHETWSRNTN